MDVRTELQKLPSPDAAAADRVWQRYRESRAQNRSAFRWWMPVAGVGLALAAAALVLRLAPADAPRTLALDAPGESVHQTWSDVVELDVQGTGVIAGTDRSLEIDWEAGTLTAQVMPNSGTRLAIITDEARVEVVGTVFSVTRDQLGVTTSVAKGKVRVACTEGWEGFVTPADGPRTCLPVSPALLLNRADALSDRGAGSASVLDSLDRGLAVAESGSHVHGELLARRVEVRAKLGQADAVLADARTYLDTSNGLRATEVNRHAGWMLMAERGCDAALAFLEPLETAGNDADRVLLAECVASSDPGRARGLLEAALSGTLDTTWSDRAKADLAALEGR